MPLLKVENLSVSFKSENRIIPAVDNISFSLDKGQLLGVVGESGSGKSVSALSIMQLLPYPQAFHPSGKILFEGQDLVQMSDKQMKKIRGNKISMIFQEPMTSLNPLHTIEKQISEVLFVHRGMSKNQAREECLRLLDMVGLGELKDRLAAFPHELSGGQRQRVMIAMALANEPEILIADEPTTALDVTVQEQILKLLKDLQKKYGMAIILISHDLGVVKKMADKICVMQNGKIVEQNTTAKLFKEPKHEYTRHLLLSKPKGSPKKIAKNAKKIIEAQSLKVSFPVKKNFFGKPLAYVNAVKNATIDLKEAETLGIVGESGSGKSTLALALLRLIRSEGAITFEGRRIDEVKGVGLRPLRKEMQIVFQDPFASLNPRMTVSQIISEGLEAHNIGKNRQERDNIICEKLDIVGLDADIRSRYPHEFSGGQRQRISIARAIALDPKLIVLDEPTSALDLSVQAQIVDLLLKLQVEFKISYIFISHDLRVVKAMSHKIIVMKQGDIVESGSVSDIFKKPKTDYTRVLIKASGV